MHSDFSYLNALSRTICSQERDSSIEEEILAYMTCYSVHGEYITGNGKRKKLCEDLGISTKTYERAIAGLVNRNIIKKLVRPQSRQYCAYRLPEALYAAKESKENYRLTIEFER